MLPSDVDLFRSRFPSTCRLATGLSTSEAGSLTEFEIGPYVAVEGPAVPVGYPVVDKEVLLLDDAGRQVAAGEVG